MSKNIRLIATAIPHLPPAGSKPPCLHVSLLLSPQLLFRDGDAEVGPLYYEVLNWPLYGAFFRHAIRFRLLAFDANWNKQGDLLAAAGECQQPNSYDPHDMSLWRGMIPPDTLVSHWQDGTAPYELADLLTNDKLNTDIKQALEDSLTEYLERTASDPTAEQQNRVDWVRRLARLPLHELLDNAYFDLALDLQELRDKLNNIVRKFNAERDNLLLRLELEGVKQRNISNTREFHKRFSAYAQHPELLRRTGWLWDYALDPELKPDYFDHNGDTGQSLRKHLQDWEAKKYQVFITIDDRAFQLSDPAPPKRQDSAPPKNNGWANDYLASLLRAPELQDMALRKAVPGYDIGVGVVDNGSNPQLSAFWLSFLSELDVHCPLTAVQSVTMELPELASWRVRSQPSLPAAGQTYFEQFDDYVKVQALGNNTSFAVESQLLDRLTLYQRLEALMLRQASTDGVSTAPEPALLANTALQSPVERYVGKGIILAIRKLHMVVAAAIEHGPDEQRKRAIDTAAEWSNNDIAALLTNSAIVYQHNVQHGYRADVVALNPRGRLLYAGSLCAKDEEYRLPDNSTQHPRSRFNNQLEGWLSEPAQLGNNGMLYVDEELFHWNDWNLVTPFGNSQTADPDDDAELGISIRSRASKQSQVLLRYGFSYSFALRPADLCGNSALPVGLRLANGGDWERYQDEFRNFLAGSASLPQDQDFSKYFTQPIIYQRVDGVAQPWLLPEPMTDGSGDELTTSHLTTLVVRSIFNPQTKLLESLADDCAVRLLAPPRLGLQQLLQHGHQDGHLHSAVPPRAYLEELISWDAGQPVHRPADCLHYLADPLADGFVLELDGHPYPVQMLYANALGNEHYWRNLRYHRLRLVPQEPVAAPAAGPAPAQVASLLFEANWPADPGRETVLKLGRGFSHEISLRCTLPAPHNGALLPNLLLPGLREQAWPTPLSVPPRWDMSTPDPGGKLPVTVVHAVEKPCLLYAKYNHRLTGVPSSSMAAADLTVWHFAADVTPLPSGYDKFQLSIPCRKFLVWERPAEATELRFELEFAAFPVLTSGAFRLHAFTAEVVCDRRSEDGYRVEYTKRLLQAGLNPERGTSTGPTDSRREHDVRFANLRHALPTTRYCRVGYELEAVSRFAEYFPPSADTSRSAPPDTHSVTGYTFATFDELTQQIIKANTVRSLFDQELTRTLLNDAKGQLLSVPSSSRPLTPVIEKIVPLLHWSSNNDGDDRHIERGCHTFRVYFEGDWYSSGWGEQVAVLFKVDQGNNDGLGAYWDDEALSLTNVLRFKRTQYQELSISTLASQFGSDPVSTARRITKKLYGDIFVDETNMPLEPLPVQVADLEWTHPPYTGASPGPEALAQLELLYVLYPVQYASAARLNREAGYNSAISPQPEYYIREGRFYIDICVKPEYLQGEYFPFLRFALARYQPNSIQPLVNVIGTAGEVLVRRSKSYCFSKVVLTDFCQPLPQRSLTLRPKDSGELDIVWPAKDKPKNPGRDVASHPSLLACYVNPLANRVGLDPAAPSTQYVFQIDHPTREGSEFFTYAANQPSAPDAVNYRMMRFEVPGASSVITLPAQFLGLLPGTDGTLTLSEYEFYENDELIEHPAPGSSQPAYLPTDDPRLDPRYRLVFTYLLSYSKPSGGKLQLVKMISLLLFGALLGLSGSLVTAQPLLRPQPGQADSAYSAGTRLHLLAQPRCLFDTLLLESDLVDYPPQYTVAFNERKLPRRCWLHWGRPALITVLKDSVCAVGTFGRPGLHQLRIAVRPANSTCYKNYPTLPEIDYWYAYSDRARQTRPSRISLVAMPTDSTVRIAYQLLDSALRYSRPEVLRRRWDSLLLKAKAPPVAGQQLGLVLAYDHPLALLVPDNKLADDPDLLPLLRVWLRAQLPALFHQFTLPATSARLDSNGHPIAVLKPSDANRCVATLQSLLDSTTVLPTFYDSGQLLDALQQAGIGEYQDSSVCRLLPVSSHFRQLELVLRLHSAEPGKVLNTQSIDSLINGAVKFAHLVAAGGRVLCLPAAAGGYPFAYDLPSGQLIRLTVPRQPVSLAGAGLWQSNILLVADKRTYGESPHQRTDLILCYDLVSGSTTALPILYASPADRPRPAGSSVSNVGLATNPAQNRCYLLQNWPAQLGGVLRSFQVKAGARQLPSRLEADQELLLPFPGESSQWHYVGLTLDSLGEQLLILKTRYTSANAATNRFVVESVALGQDGQLLPTAKPKLLLSLTNFVNARAADYGTNLTGIALVGNRLYFLANLGPAAPGRHPPLFFDWLLRAQ